jgi:hypothetical protein
MMTISGWGKDETKGEDQQLLDIISKHLPSHCFLFSNGSLSFVGFQHLIWVNFQSRAFDTNEAALAQFGQNLVLPTEVMHVRWVETCNMTCMSIYVAACYITCSINNSIYPKCYPSISSLLMLHEIKRPAHNFPWISSSILQP